MLLLVTCLTIYRPHARSEEGRPKRREVSASALCQVELFFASELKLQISISKVDILEADSVCRLHTYTLSLTPAQPSDSRPTPRPINLTMANQ